MHISSRFSWNYHFEGSRLDISVYIMQHKPRMKWHRRKNSENYKEEKTIWMTKVNLFSRFYHQHFYFFQRARYVKVYFGLIWVAESEYLLRFIFIGSSFQDIGIINHKSLNNMEGSLWHVCGCICKNKKGISQLRQSIPGCP